MKRLGEAQMYIAQGALLKIEYSQAHWWIHKRICKIGSVHPGNTEFLVYWEQKYLVDSHFWLQC